MTSLLFSIFSSSSTQLNARVETMRAAELALISFAHRFGGDQTRDSSRHHTSPQNNNGHDGNSHPAFVEFLAKPNGKGDEDSMKDKQTHHYEFFDTKIPRDAIPLRQDGSSCQMRNFPRHVFQDHDPAQEEEIHNQDRYLFIHGVKVTSKLYQQRVQEENERSKSAHPTENDKEEYPLVMLHGYMNGALYFYRNLVGLSNYGFGGEVYALDMLGWGLSSRPKFQTKAIQGYESDDTHATEQVFVESLEEWRKAHKIDKMVLGGHSMGGYLATAYAEKYPERIDRLILISPAGVPDDQHVDVEGRIKAAPFSFRIFVGMVSSLWNMGVTPASFLRSLPETRGRKMVENYIRGRLPSITCPQEQKYLGEYLYTNAALPGSGEDCLGKILKPTTFAYKPTLHRIPFLRVKHVSFIYGQNDWMDPLLGGVETLRRCQEMKKDGEPTPEVRVYGVRNAGHLLMLENWKEFNSAMILAAGRSERLPADFPLPFEVLEPMTNDRYFRPSPWQKKQSTMPNGRHDNSTRDVDAAS